MTINGAEVNLTKTMSRTKKFFLYYNTMKYMRYRQILWRILFHIKKIVYKIFNVYLISLYSKKIKNIDINNNFKFFVGSEVIKRGIGLHDARINKTEEVKTLLAANDKEHEFRFLNKSITFCNKIEWQSSTLERLWLYNLHYFDYAFELGIERLIENKPAVFHSFKYLVLDWIRENSKIGSGVGWEPYPVSLRIVNWIFAYYLFIEEINEDTEFKNSFIKSIAIQTEFLSNHIEYHVGKNHLIKNGKALYLASLFFEKKYTSNWKKKGLNVLLHEIKEQILDDGGHYERSPMYHLIVLQDYLEIFVLAKRNKIDFPVDKELKKMVIFSQHIIHPDKQISLFNDSAFKIAKDPEELFIIGADLFYDLVYYNRAFKTSFYTVLLTGKTKPVMDNNKKNETNDKKSAISQSLQPEMQSTLFNDSGFCTFRDKTNEKYMIVSCKSPSPFFSPGHSHADIFSYELSFGNKRFIADSGTYNYIQGECRDYFRSTKAHNTLTVNSENQSEIWGTFGIARRSISEHVEAKTINCNSFIFEGLLKGLPNIYPIYHKRNIFFLDDQFWFIFDTIKSDNKELHHHNVESFIHIHPARSVKVTKSNGNIENIIIDENDKKLKICRSQISTNLDNNSESNLKTKDCNTEVIQGLYSSEFGKITKNKVIVFNKKGSLPIYIGYILFPYINNNPNISAICNVNYFDKSNVESNLIDIEIATPGKFYLIRKEGNDVRVVIRNQN